MNILFYIVLYLIIKKVTPKPKPITINIESKPIEIDNLEYMRNMFSITPLLTDNFDVKDECSAVKCDTMVTNNILYNVLISKSFLWMDKIDGKLYELFDIKYFSDETILFFFNKNRPFVIVFGGCYYKFLWYIDVKKMNCYDLNIDYRGFSPKFTLDVINSIKNPIKKHIKNKYKKYLFYGFCPHMGHHMIELGGLFHFLNKINDFSDNIEAIVIGKYDHFNIKKYFETLNFKILSFEEDIKNKQENYIPIILTHYPIEKNVENIITSLCNYKVNSNKNISTIEITLDIRTHSRSELGNLTNLVDIFTYIIKKMLSDYPNYKLIINFTGIYLKKSDSQHHIKLQNNIIENIIAKVNDINTIYNNYIGENIYFLINHVMNSNIFFGAAGTSSMALIQWIYGTKCVLWGGSNYKDFMNIYIKNNVKSFTFIPEEYLDINKNEIIDIQNAYIVLKKELENTIN